jgi:hypothetical protein
MDNRLTRRDRDRAALERSREERACFAGAVDRALAAAEADAARQGLSLGAGRVIPRDDGWQLERLEATTAGTARWERLYFSRRRQDVEAAARRRGVVIIGR